MYLQLLLHSALFTNCMHRCVVAAPAGGGRGWVPCRWSERTLSCEKGPPRECG